ncbi:hypothetical protein V8F06_002361 [Rhypophila decipiens]
MFVFSCNINVHTTQTMSSSFFQRTLQLNLKRPLRPKHLPAPQKALCLPLHCISRMDTAPVVHQIYCTGVSSAHGTPIIVTETPCAFNSPLHQTWEMRAGEMRAQDPTPLPHPSPARQSIIAPCHRLRPFLFCSFTELHSQLFHSKFTGAGEDHTDISNTQYRLLSFHSPVSLCLPVLLQCPVSNCTMQDFCMERESRFCSRPRNWVSIINRG